MQIRAFLALITLLLFTAAPVQSERCALHCAVAMNGAHREAPAKHAMAGPHAHCSMTMAASGLKHATSPGCHDDCAIASSSPCPGHQELLSDLPSENLLVDATSPASAVTAMLAAFSPPFFKAMDYTRVSSALLPLPVPSLSINFRV